MSRRSHLLAAACVAAQQLFSSGLIAQQPQNDSDDAPQSSGGYADVVRADQPMAYWRFEDDKAAAELNGSPLSPQQITAGIKFSQPGARRDKFPLFEKANRAAVFEKPASIRYEDPGEQSVFDFAAGDSITLEAWVNPTKIASG